VRTRVHETRGGGWHFIFKHSIGLRSSNKLASGVEFLSTGRWAVWWPSHAGRVLCEGPVAVLPDWLHEVLAWQQPADGHDRVEVRPSTFHSAKPLQATNSTCVRSKYLLLKLERTYPGNRHKMLHWTACRFGNMVGESKMKIEVAEHLLIEAAKANGLWQERPDNCLRTIRDGLQTGKEEWIAGNRADFLFSEDDQHKPDLKVVD
jgi:hypothetical protein